MDLYRYIAGLFKPVMAYHYHYHLRQLETPRPSGSIWNLWYCEATLSPTVTQNLKSLKTIPKRSTAKRYLIGRNSSKFLNIQKPT